MDQLKDLGARLAISGSRIPSANLLSRIRQWNVIHRTIGNVLIHLRRLLDSLIMSSATLYDTLSMYINQCK